MLSSGKICNSIFSGNNKSFGQIKSVAVTQPVIFRYNLGQKIRHPIHLFRVGHRVTIHRVYSLLWHNIPKGNGRLSLQGTDIHKHDSKVCQQFCLKLLVMFPVDAGCKQKHTVIGSHVSRSTQFNMIQCYLSLVLSSYSALDKYNWSLPFLCLSYQIIDSCHQAFMHCICAATYLK